MISFVTCARNCGWRIEEWVRYHARLGVEKFLIYDDSSADDTQAIIRGLAKEFDIRALETDKLGAYVSGNGPNYYGGNVSVVARLARSYKSGLEVAKSEGAKWAGVFDLDEFVVPVSERDCRAVFLKDYFVERITANTPRIYVHSFDMRVPSTRVSDLTASCQTSWSKQTKNFAQNGLYRERGKSFINLSVWSGRCDCVHNIDGSPCINEGDDTRLSEEHRRKCLAFNDNIRINHYRSPPMINIFDSHFPNASLVWK